MARAFVSLVVTVFILCTWISQAHAKQVALVIGIARYDTLPTLLNPKRDAGAVGDRLRDLGFEVIEAFDADRTDIKRATDRFVGAARGADLALFYFAGHGVQLFDRNVLVARDANPTTASSLDDLGLDLTAFAQRLKAVSPVRFALMVDACRDNPLSFDATVAFMRRVGANASAPSTAGQLSRGLAPITVERSSAGNTAETLIFYAAEPGHVSSDGSGQNSYVVEGLLEALAKADVAFNDALRSASAYVRTVTRGAQVPQVYSDWTSDIVLGRHETAKVRYLNASRTGGGELTKQQLHIVGEGNRSLPALRGTFIISERQAFTLEQRELDAVAQKRIDDIGRVNGFAIDYDLERRGRPDTIGVYFRQSYVTFEVVSESVSQLSTPCFRAGDMDEVESVEIALRDINGDRRPEIFVHYRAKDDPWGTFCILEYVGIANRDASRRGPSSVRAGDDTGVFRLLLRETGMNVSVGQDNSIEICSGSNCHTRTQFGFDGTTFRMTLDESDPPTSARARPFRDESERARHGGVRQAVASTRGTPSPQAPAQSATSIGQVDMAAVQRFVSDVYLADGNNGTINTPFGASVSYYGRQRSRAEIIADKRAYYAKWSQRRYQLDPGTLRVMPSKVPIGGFDLTFEYTFAVSGGGKVSAGRGRTRLTVIRAADHLAIVREEGEVIARQ